MGSARVLLLSVALSGIADAFHISPVSLRAPSPSLKLSRGGMRRGAVAPPLALQAQLKPEDRKHVEVFMQSFKEGVDEFWSKEAADGRAPPNLPSLLLIPVWAGLIGAALMLPSPEIVEAAASSGSSTLSGLLDGAAEGAGVFLGAAPSTQGGLSLEQLASKNLDPNLFVPVCRFSDGFYRTAKNSVYSLAGSETYQEYAPLIAGSLLRVRLEFCVLESFVYESIIPFIKARGLSWVFPLKETVETFVAGVVFAVATNLVLIGSTKIVTIFVSYADFFVGLPLRFVFGFTEDRIKQFGFDKNPLGGALAVTAKAGKLVGQASGGTRALVETADVFVGRYLLLTTVGYVILKFLKFKGVLTLESVGVFLTNLVHIFDAPATDTATAAAQAAASLFL